MKTVLQLSAKLDSLKGGHQEKVAVKKAVNSYLLLLYIKILNKILVISMENKLKVITHHTCIYLLIHYMESHIKYKV